jgi:hypothetical protein
MTAIGAHARGESKFGGMPALIIPINVARGLDRGGTRFPQLAQGCLLWRCSEWAAIWGTPDVLPTQSGGQPLTRKRHSPKHWVAGVRIATYAVYLSF